MMGSNTSKGMRGLVAVAMLIAGLTTAEARAEGAGRHLEVGRTLIEAGAVPAGLRHVALVVRLEPANIAAQTYLLGVLDLDRYRGDVALHEAVAEVLPGYRPVMDRLARLYELHFRYADAAALHLREAGLAPGDAESQARLAVYFAFVGRPDLARAALARYEELGGDGETLRRRLPADTFEASRDGPPRMPRAVGAGPGEEEWREISLEPMAQEGDPIAMFVAGRKYLINAANAGRSEWRARGLTFLEGAARAGFTPARRFLASLYLEGETVPRDLPRAVAHLERAASAGEVIAQRELGDMYFTGTVLPRNLSRAAYWYQTILDNPEPGYKRGEMWRIELRLGRLYMEGKGVEKDPSRAIALWRNAATVGGSPQAQRALAEAYERGLGGGGKPAAALDLYYSAATNFLDHGFLHGVDPASSRAEVATILAAMERIEPEGRLTRRLRTRVERLE